MQLVVGLGNPGPRYESTRHNVGRDYIGHVVSKESSKFSDQRQAEIARLPLFFAARLTCFMNESGGPIKGLMVPKGWTPDQIVVIVDDFMIPFGTLRLRPAGSSGGHNGLKSIIDVLGTDRFPRLRVGVGPVPEYEDPADFVLKKFNAAERGAMPQIYEAITGSLSKISSEGVEKAMNWTNKSHLQ